MKRLALMAVLALGGLVAVTPLTHAQDGTNAAPKRERGQRGPGGPGGARGGGESMMKERMDKMAKDLNLTDEQKTKVEAIMKENREKMGAVFQDSSLSREDRMAKLKTLRDESNTQINAILTAEQKPKFEAMQKENEERMKNRLREGRAPGAPGQGAGEKKSDKQ